MLLLLVPKVGRQGIPADILLDIDAWSRGIEANHSTPITRSHHRPEQVRMADLELLTGETGVIE